MANCSPTSTSNWLRKSRGLQTDTIELRISLAPYVLSWNECFDEQFSAGDKKHPSAGDREVEFELSSTAPKLDHLRWLLSQIPDMHVPAASLHTAERYTGARLPYDLIEAMDPPVAVVKKMLATAKEVAEWRGKAGSLQQDLVTNLEDHLVRKASRCSSGAASPTRLQPLSKEYAVHVHFRRLKKCPASICSSASFSFGAEVWFQNFPGFQPSSRSKPPPRCVKNPQNQRSSQTNICSGL